jgi:hypothetical protein
MAWKPKIIEGGRSGGKVEPVPKGRGGRPQEAFTLGCVGFQKVDKRTGGTLWDFLDLDTDTKKRED